MSRWCWRTSSPRTEIQLLRYRHPDPLLDPHIRDLHKLGMNHVCFAVDDIEAEVAKFRAGGFTTRNEIMDFIPASWCSSKAPKASRSNSRSGRRSRHDLDFHLLQHGSPWRIAASSRSRSASA